LNFGRHVKKLNYTALFKGKPYVRRNDVQSGGRGGKQTGRGSRGEAEKKGEGTSKVPEKIAEKGLRPGHVEKNAARGGKGIARGQQDQR